MERRSSVLRGPVQLDLAVDLGAIEDRALDQVGSYVASACFTAVMLVMAPPMPDRASDGRPAVQPAEVRGDRGHGFPQHLGRHDAVEAELLRVPHGADVHAEALVNAFALPERELRAATAGVEHRQRALGQPEPALTAR